MIAGRSPWLCQGTMPPGSIVSLRNRSWRSLMFAGSFSRSMAASTVSVTPLPAWVAGARTSAFNLPAGHSPAADADKPATVAPAVIAARTTPRPPAIRLNMFVISFVTLRPEGAAAGRRIDRTGSETEMPNGFKFDSGTLWSAAAIPRAIATGYRLNSQSIFPRVVATRSLLVVRFTGGATHGRPAEYPDACPGCPLRSSRAVAGSRHEKWAPGRFGGPSQPARRPDHAFSRHPPRGRG